MSNGSLSATSRDASFSSSASPSPSSSPSSPAIKEAAARAVQAAITLVNRGQYPSARPYFEEALRLDPDNANYHVSYGACIWELGERDLAHQSFLKAQELDPTISTTQRLLSQWYLQEGVIEEALSHSAKAVELAPDDNAAAAVRAMILESAGESDAAWEMTNRLLSIGFAPPMLLAMYARMARRRGHADQALAMLGIALQSRSFPAKHESSLRYAASELLDGLGRYDEAFAQATAGNLLRRPPYNPAIHERTFDGLIAYFTRERMAKLPRAEHRSRKPVFIVGMPRSGTSLVEQILASHPSVHGAGELDFINRVFAGTLTMLSATVDQYPACLDRLTVEMADGLAQVYLEPLIAMDPAAERITDKLPLNFLHLGLIALLLPDAHIIHCRRDPLDTCLSCYMTEFAVANDFKYDLTHAGLFYRLYQRLMEHWKSVLDIPILDVDYEQMIAEPEAQSRRLVEFIGLPWDERCLRFHESKRPVITASAQQVRKPIYNSSVQRWRHYEKHLAPLKRALGMS